MKPAFLIARAALLSAVVLALGACQQEAKQEAGAGRTAQGEVLEGSISDAMLPYDTVRSQPPLAPKNEASGGPKDGDDKTGNEKAGTKPAKPEVAADSAPAAAEQ